MTKQLTQGFSITKVETNGTLTTQQIHALSLGHSQFDWYSCNTFPMQVHEVLLTHGVITNTGHFGKCEEYAWVAQNDWVYRCEFDVEEEWKKVWLRLRGLDTLCTIYLNGEKVGEHADMYMPCEVTIAPKQHNVLLIFFRSPEKYLETYELPAEFENILLKRKTIRKAQHDFDGYLGAKPYSTPIGVFDQIELHCETNDYLRHVDIQTWMKHDLRTADVFVTAEVETITKGVSSIRVTLLDPQGNVVLQEQGQQTVRLRVSDMELWYPIGLGKQPLYTVKTELLSDMQVVDQSEKRIGFRELLMVKPMQFEVNGMPVRLWGANFAPLDGIAHTFSKERFDELMPYVIHGNMNVLRIWGEGIPYPDALYDYADEHGILLWMDFFGESKMHPDTEEFVALCAKEAETMVKHLSHRPSILLWCGGNEMEMWAEVDHPGDKKIGEEIYKKAYRSVVGQWDPQRVYWDNSPYGGGYANDPLAGDTHGYDHHSCYVPGIRYPLMFSENTRISPPSLRSLRRFMTDEEIYPKDFVPSARPGKLELIPDSWEKRSADRMVEKFGPLESFYDPTNAEELVCNTGAARGLQLKTAVEYCRRGRPAWEQECRCFGHMVWKLNDTWPQIYTSVIDYYMEPFMPYYALKRAYAPVLLSYDTDDKITLWLCNDTAQTIQGTLRYGTQHMETEVKNEFELPIVVKPFTLEIVADYQSFGMLDRKELLYAELTMENGEVINAMEFLDTDRYTNFPDATLTLRAVAPDAIAVTTDHVAHGVEIVGDHNGDEFGWHFDDNYFDLMPGQTKIVRFLGKHEHGVIRAKTRYDDKWAEVEV